VALKGVQYRVPAQGVLVKNASVLCQLLGVVMDDFGEERRLVLENGDLGRGGTRIDGQDAEHGDTPLCTGTAGVRANDASMFSRCM
jgi:hypothetical protein